MDIYKVLIFGTGSGYQRTKKFLNQRNVTIVGFLDNNKSASGKVLVDDIPVFHPNEMPNDFDFIIIASQSYKEIKNQLITLNVSVEKIISFFEPITRNNIENSFHIVQYPIFLVEEASQRFEDLSECILKNSEQKRSSGSGTLLISHPYGGGTQVYQDILIERMLKEKNRVYTLHILLNNLIIVDLESKCEYGISMNVVNQLEFNTILEFFGIDMIYINHLISFPLFTMMELFKESNVNYTFFIHDYFCACPNYNLLTSDYIYCNAETDIKKCRSCISNGLLHASTVNPESVEIDIAKWRKTFSEFLSQAKHVYSPSNSSRMIVNQYYPDLEIKVIEHELGIDISKTNKNGVSLKDQLNIAFIGEMSIPKGSKHLYEIYELIRLHKLPISITVIGTTEKQALPFQSSDKILTVHGKYARTEIAYLLETYKIDVVVIPTIWPETYNYTTSEVMAAGYPVLTFDLGAPAERIKHRKGGWVIKDISSEAILEMLEKIITNQTMITEQIKNLRLRII